MPKIREPGTRPGQQKQSNTAEVQGQSNTAEPEKQKPHWFQPGVSGNPRGKMAGTRDVINKEFLRDFVAGWRDYGIEAIRAMARNQPAQFVQVAASLLPKQLELDAEHRHYGVSDKLPTAEEWAVEIERRGETAH